MILLELPCVNCMLVVEEGSGNDLHDFKNTVAPFTAAVRELLWLLTAFSFLLISQCQMSLYRQNLNIMYDWHTDCVHKPMKPKLRLKFLRLYSDCYCGIPAKGN